MHQLHHSENSFVYLTRSAKLPRLGYIFYQFFSLFFIFFNGWLGSSGGSEPNRPSFTKISGLVDGCKGFVHTIELESDVRTVAHLL